jgi:hypothetical protein
MKLKLLEKEQKITCQALSRSCIFILIEELVLSELLFPSGTERGPAFEIGSKILSI